MKIRSGFVSNSSSCSFIVLGFVSNEDYDDIDDIYLRYEQKGYDVVSLETDLIIGRKLCLSHDWGLEDKKWSVEELQDMSKEISEDCGVNLSDINVHMGTRMC